MTEVLMEWVWNWVCRTNLSIAMLKVDLSMANQAQTCLQMMAENLFYLILEARPARTVMATPDFLLWAPRLFVVAV